MQFINRLIFNLNATDIGDVVVREAKDYIAKPLCTKEELKKKFEFVKDLLNVTLADNNLDSSGRAIGGRISSSDLSGETQSPIIWAFYIPLLLSSLLTIILSIVILALSFKVPSAVMAATLLDQSHFDATIKFFEASIILNTVSFLPLWITAYYFYIILCEKDPSNNFAVIYWTFFKIIGALIILVPFLGPVASIVLAIFTNVFVILGTKSQMLARSSKLEKNTQEANSLMISRDYENSVKKLEHQFSMALKRSDPLIIFGHSLGVMRREGDMMTPDGPINGAKKGGAIALDCGEDLSVPLLVYAESGSGKTVVYKSIFLQFVEITGRTKEEQDANYKKNGRRVGAGILAIDFKGKLPFELEELAIKMGFTERFILLSPDRQCINFLNEFGNFKIVKGRSLNEGLIEAMKFDTPVIKILSDIFKSNSQNETVWDKYLKLSLTYMLHLLSYIKYVKVNSNGEYDHYNWPRTLKTIHYLIVNEEKRDELIDELRKNHMHVINQYGPLEAAFNHFAITFPDFKKGPTMTSILMTIDADVGLLVNSVGMQNWVAIEDSDLSIADELESGKFIAPFTSEDRYGQPGILVAQFLESIVQNIIKWRENLNSDWQLQGKFPILYMADEWARGASDQAKFFSQSRSGGLRVICFLQSKKQLIAKLGANDANEIESLFLNQITYKVDDETLESSTNRLEEVTRFVKVDSQVKIQKLGETLKREQNNGLINRSDGAWIETFASIGSALNDLMKKTSLHVHDRQKAITDVDRMGNDDYKMVVQKAITPKEVNPYLSMKNVALVNFQRCGKYPRREVCQILPYYELFEGLNEDKNTKKDIEQLEADYASFPSLNGINEITDVENLYA